MRSFLSPPPRKNQEGARRGIPTVAMDRTRRPSARITEGRGGGVGGYVKCCANRISGEILYHWQAFMQPRVSAATSAATTRATMTTAEAQSNTLSHETRPLFKIKLWLSVLPAALQSGWVWGVWGGERKMRGVKCQRFRNDLICFLTLAGPSRLDNGGVRGAVDRREARSQLHYCSRRASGVTGRTGRAC